MFNLNITELNTDCRVQKPGIGPAMIHPRRVAGMLPWMM